MRVELDATLTLLLSAIFTQENAILFRMEVVVSLTLSFSRLK